MDERIKFWANSARWPVDGLGYVFLARAVHEVGRALFGSEWTGSEPVAPKLYNLPCLVLPNGTKIRLSQTEAKPWQKVEVHDLLRSKRPDFGRGLRQSGPFGAKPLTFTNEEWAAGIDLAAEVDAERRNIHRRYSKAVSSIVDALRAGNLISALRPLPGGQIAAPLQAYVWNTEQTDSRFCWCQMNPHKPFDDGVGGASYQYIFVEREGLTRLVGELKKVEPTKRHIGDVKKFESWLTARINESPHHRKLSKKEIRRKASDDFRLSERQADAARERVLNKFDAKIQSIWQKGGRPTEAA